MTSEEMIDQIDNEVLRLSMVLTEARHISAGVVMKFKQQAYQLNRLRALYEADLFPQEY